MSSSGRVEAVYIASSGGLPMQRLHEVEALEGLGLAGDRFVAGTSYWSGVDECQVTLIAGEDLDAITVADVSDGRHRRNIVTRGVDLQALAGRVFRVGEVVLGFNRPRPPCRYIQTVSEPGMTRALGGRRGGICADVLKAGVIRTGDPIEIVTADVGSGTPEGS